MPPVPTVSMISSKFTTSRATIRKATATVDTCAATGWTVGGQLLVAGPDEQADAQGKQHQEDQRLGDLPRVDLDASREQQREDER